MKRKKGRYWVFGFDGYYPKGGMNDYIFSFNDIEEFEEEILKQKWDMYQLLDTETHYNFQTHQLDDLTKWVCKNIGDEKYEKTDY